MSTIQVYLINSNGHLKVKVYIQSENPGTRTGTSVNDPTSCTRVGVASDYSTSIMVKTLC